MFNLPGDVLPHAVRCAIWYHLYSFKKVENAHGKVLLLVKLQTTRSTSPLVFFTFFKFCKLYQIAQSILYIFKKIWTTLSETERLFRIRHFLDTFKDDRVYQCYFLINRFDILYLHKLFYIDFRQICSTKTTVMDLVVHQ